MIKPSNSVFSRLIKYGYYRLRDVLVKHSLAAEQRIENLTKRLYITLKTKLDRSDRILVSYFHFLPRLVDESDMFSIKEGQTYFGSNYLSK